MLVLSILMALCFPPRFMANAFFFVRSPSDQSTVFHAQL